uniref:Cystatin domain-containing protein n=1 Tax=Pygocentrus nattereri TaxID=42514 RepID=A0AAR2L386_PYGNA
MSAVLKLLLLSAVTLLVSAQGSENYQNLSESIRIHIDKALDKANEYFTNHYVAYESLLSKPTITADDFYVNVRLMVTTCKKDKEKGYGHRVECVTQKPKTPWIDCLVCKKENGGELIDCARQVDVRSGRDIRKHCAYRTHGGATVLSQKSGNSKQELGCLGCV